MQHNVQKKKDKRTNKDLQNIHMKLSYWTKDSYLLGWSHYFERFMVAIMTSLTAMEYLCHK
jgi:hypothetical protein